MGLLLASLGLLVLSIGAAAGVILARRQRLSAKRVIFAVLGIGLGGTLGATPGMYLLLGSVVTSATGPRGGSGPISWPYSLQLVVVAAGLGAGALMGLTVAEKLNGQRTRAVALATSTGGLVAGCLVATLGIFLAQQSPLELAALMLIPLTVIGMTLAGYVLPAPTT